MDSEECFEPGPDAPLRRPERDNSWEDDGAALPDDGEEL
jgi:hypothetical protein